MTNEERYFDLLKLNPNSLSKPSSKQVANYIGFTPITLSRVMKRVNEKNN